VECKKSERKSGKGEKRKVGKGVRREMCQLEGKCLSEKRK